jgi:hypothetical protein
MIIFRVEYNNTIRDPPLSVCLSPGCISYYIRSNYNVPTRIDFNFFFLKEQKNIDDMKLILKDLRNVTKSIDKYERNLNDSNVTTHDVSAMAAIKIGYDFIYSTLEKIFNKGAEPSNFIHQNGSQHHQTFYNPSNGSQIHQNYNITIVNNNNTIQMKSKFRRLIENSTHETWHRFVDDSSPPPASGPSHITTVSQEGP